MHFHPRRILLHLGFHKTGTSSIQHLLWTNRALLRPAVTVLQLRHLKPAADICHHFSRHQSPVALSNLVAAMDAILAEHLDADPAPALILSCEGLSGHLPGWPGVDTYRAAPITAAFLAGYFADRIPGAEMQIVCTTREPEPWLFSVWRHHLLGQRLRMDWPIFAARFRLAADLTRVVADMAEAVAPVPVHDLPLERSATHPLGPGGALLDMLDLPADIRAGIVPVGHGNAGPDPNLSAEFLALNRSALPDEQVRRRKAALASERGAGGWAKSPGRLPTGG